MINRLIYYEKYEISLNYGISTSKDYHFLNQFISFLESFVSSMNPKSTNFNTFGEIINIYERTKKLERRRNRTDKMNAPLVFYGFNICKT